MQKSERRTRAPPTHVSLAGLDHCNSPAYLASAKKMDPDYYIKHNPFKKPERSPARLQWIIGARHAVVLMRSTPASRSLDLALSVVRPPSSPTLSHTLFSLFSSCS